MANKYGVIVSVAGQQPKAATVSAGATVKSALMESGMSESQVNAFNGEIRIGNKRADLGTRLTKGAFVNITPKVAGGR